MPDTDENWSRARDSAREELVTVDQYIANKAQLALLEKRAEKKKS